jgi:phage portal protein BeeE
MKLLGFHITRSAPPPTTPEYSMVSPEGAAWLAGKDLDEAGPALSNAYEQVVWVYRAINVLAEQVANIPFRFSVGSAGGDQLITNGPLVDFYNRPHPQINRFQYWELRIMWLMLRGECVRIPIYEDSPLHLNPNLSLNAGLPRSPSPIKNQNSKLKNVLILNPAHFHHIIENHQLIGWRYTGLGPDAPLEAQVFLPEEVWFEKLPNPFDFWRGMSPLQVAGMAARTDYAAGAFMKGVIENNGDIGVIVRSQQQMSDEQQAALLAALNNRKRRAGIADRPLLLSGVTEITKPELSSSDLQFLENRKFSRTEICAAFGVPEEIVTTTEHSKYDVMAGARLNFIENRVAPLCARLEAEENITTVPAVLGLPPDTRHLSPVTPVGWFDLDSLPIMQEARRSRLASAKTGFELGVPFNELNRVLDLGFKPLPWGDVGYVPAGMQRLGQAETQGKGNGT